METANIATLIMPDIIKEFLEMLAKIPGSSFLLLSPVENEDEKIIDFTIISAGNALEQSVKKDNLVGQKLGDIFPSFHEWENYCRLALQDGRVTKVTVPHVNNSRNSYKVIFTRLGELLLGIWETEPANKSAANEAGRQPNAQPMMGHTLVEETEKMKASLRNVVHEIRNPLTAVRLATEQLLQPDGTNDAESRAVLADIVYRSCDKIEEHIKLLVGSEPSKQLCLEPVEIHLLIEQALMKAENRLFLDHITIEKDYVPGHIINGDLEKLCTVFLNIIINAIEAMHKTGGRLRISVMSEEDKVKVIFTDNGLGMDDPTQKKIFIPHFSTKKSGLGIGLSNVKDILDLHQADIMVDSELGKGTSFIIVFKKQSHP